MSWVDYTETLRKSSNEMKERNDCTVKAWTNVFDCDYKAAHGWLRRFGRRDGHGIMPANLKKALLACKKAKVKFGPYSRERRITVSQFCKKHPVGRYYVANRDHAFCIKDGVVHDWQHGPRRQITLAARFYLEGEW